MPRLHRPRLPPHHRQPPQIQRHPDTFSAGLHFLHQPFPGRPYLLNGPTAWGGHGFWIDPGDAPGWRFESHIRLFEAPAWALLAATAALSTLLFLRSRPNHPPGSCPRCGYDLRASPTRCPECGHAAPTH